MKKTLAMIFALVMILSVCAACGGNSGDSGNAPLTQEEADAAIEAIQEQTGEVADILEDTGVPADEFVESMDGIEDAINDAVALTTIDAGKLTVSTSPDFPPYEYLDDSGAIVGIEPEIMQLIADKLGLELVLDAMDFDSALLAVQQGKSDVVMSGCTVTEDRKLVMNFTDSYTTAKQVIVVPEGSDVTLDTLGDYNIGTQRGTTGFIYTSDDYGEDHVTGYDTYTLAFQALQNGQVDCIVLDDAVGVAYVAEIPGLEILDTAYALEDYAFGVDKNNAALTEAVNNALVELMNDGTVQSIIDSYIGE